MRQNGVKLLYNTEVKRVLWVLIINQSQRQKQFETKSEKCHFDHQHMVVFYTVSAGWLHCGPAAPLFPCAPALWSACQWSHSESGSRDPGQWCGCFGSTPLLAGPRSEPAVLVPARTKVWWSTRGRCQRQKTHKLPSVTCLWLCSMALSSSRLAVEFSFRWICLRCSIDEAWRWLSSARSDAVTEPGHSSEGWYTLWFLLLTTSYVKQWILTCIYFWKTADYSNHERKPAAVHTEHWWSWNHWHSYSRFCF